MPCQRCRFRLLCPTLTGVAAKRPGVDSHHRYDRRSAQAGSGSARRQRASLSALLPIRRILYALRIKSRPRIPETT
jgi:hypothetical protein